MSEQQDGQAAGGQSRVRGACRDHGGDLTDDGLDLRVVAQHRRRVACVGEGVGQRCDAFAAGCDGCHYRYAECLGECRRIHRHAACAGLVRHVQRHHHRHAEFCEQGGEVQRAPQVLGVAHLHDQAQIFMQQCAHRGPLIVAARGQGEHPGGVEQGHLAVETGGRPGHLDRRAGVVGYVYVSAGQAME